jgi:ABC-type spermidine/putrescine transport system permease subunit I
MQLLKPNILQLTQQAAETWRLLSTEEAWVATANLGADEVVKDLTGVELEVMTPKEGTIGWMDAEMLVHDGRNQDLLVPFLEMSNQPEYIAENFIRNGRPLFNESAYKILVDSGEQERADRFLFNKPETVLTMTLKAPGTSTQGAIEAFNEVFGGAESIASSTPVYQSPTGGASEAPPVAQTEHSGRSFSRFWPAVPAVLILGVLFLGSMVFMLVFSFGRTVDFDFVPDWSLDNYARFFTGGSVAVGPITVSTYVWSFSKTLLMGVLVMAACLALALPFTYYLVRYVSRRWQRIALLAVIIPFWTSYLLRVYAWQSILGETGALNQLLQGLRIIEEPSRLFVYNDTGVLIVLIYVYFPFAALALYASLDRFDFNQFQAAQDLGARPDQAFRYVLLPQIRPGLITASIFVLVPIIGEFLTPQLVGGAQGLLIGNLVVNFLRGAQIAEGAALAIIIAAFVTTVLVIFRRHLQVEDVVARG